MSADLHAAFGAEDSTVKQSQVSRSNPESAHVRQTDQHHPSTPSRHFVQQTEENSTESPLWNRAVNGNDVLFDAGDADLQDDFGDFETAKNPIQEIFGHQDTESAATFSPDKSKVAGSLTHVPDLLGIDVSTSDTTAESQEAQQRPDDVRQSIHNDDDGWGAFEDIKSDEPPDLGNLYIKPAVQPLARRKEIVVDAPDDEWESFDDRPTTAASLPSSSTSNSESRVIAKHTTPQPVITRPTNVPPPSSLLQLLSAVFQVLHQSNAAGKTPTQDLATQVLLVYRTASRIVAGRSLRWKRDLKLAQSVRIGQSGKAGGMKLTALNKSEVTKEQRDAEDLVEDWSKQLHEFHSIIAKAGLPSRPLKLSAIVPLVSSQQTSVKNASQQCALCGLKRSERLSEIEAHVDDLFGEFWLEHWGHKDCCDFWQSYNGMLGHR